MKMKDLLIFMINNKLIVTSIPDWGAGFYCVKHINDRHLGRYLKLYGHGRTKLEAVENAYKESNND